MNAIATQEVNALTPGTTGGVSGMEQGISIVIPVYNEEETVLVLYEKIKEALQPLGKPWELIFVDDGSRDGGPQLMESVCLSDPHVKLVRLRRNFGQTAALAAGFDHACGSVIIPMDADLQNDPSDISKLLAKLDEGYDIVSGWRKCRNDPLSKRIPSFFANKLISWITGVHLHDYGCTLKAYRREVLDEVKLYTDLHRFIPALASSVGARIGEVEVTHHPRKFGNSKYGFSRTFGVLLDLITVKLLLAYRAGPMRIFGGIGFLLLGMGNLLGVGTILMKVFFGVDMTGNPLLFLTILALISGVQLLGLGFLGELNMRTYYEVQRKPIYVVREIVCRETE